MTVYRVVEGKWQRLYAKKRTATLGISAGTAQVGRERTLRNEPVCRPSKRKFATNARPRFFKEIASNVLGPIRVQGHCGRGGRTHSIRFRRVIYREIANIRNRHAHAGPKKAGYLLAELLIVNQQAAHIVERVILHDQEHAAVCFVLLYFLQGAHLPMQVLWPLSVKANPYRRPSSQRTMRQKRVFAELQPLSPSVSLFLHRRLLLPTKLASNRH